MLLKKTHILVGTIGDISLSLPPDWEFSISEVREVIFTIGLVYFMYMALLKIIELHVIFLMIISPCKNNKCGTSRSRFYAKCFNYFSWKFCFVWWLYLHVRINKCGTSSSRFYAKCFNYFSWKFCFVCLHVSFAGNHISCKINTLT